MLSAVAVCFTACQPIEGTGEKYYNLDSLLQAQTQLLVSSKAKLTKTVVLGEKTETTTVLPDSSGWANEFGTLSELALINKPVYRGLYSVSDDPDNRSNLRVLTYSAKTENNKKADVAVDQVKIYYLGSLNHIKRIEGIYTEDNELYNGTHNLSIELQDVYNKNMITSYSVVGHQKMILADSVEFAIQGQIGLN